MQNSQKTLECLFERRIIALEKSSLFDVPVEPKSLELDFDKVEGDYLSPNVPKNAGGISSSVSSIGGSFLSKIPILGTLFN